MLNDEKQYHIQLKKGDVGKYVLLPGDPGRCEPIAALFDNPVHVATNREYNTYTGYLDGVKVSVTSTGIGCPSAAIALEELVRVGADTFIRVGTSGHIQPDSVSGELAIISAAIRDEGTSKHYMPIEFPAIADIDLVMAIKRAAEKNKARYRIGITQSKILSMVNTNQSEWVLPQNFSAAGRRGRSVGRSVLRWRHQRSLLSPQCCEFVQVES